MPPRSRRDTPVEETEDPARGENLRESVRQYFAEVEDEMLRRINSTVLAPERITAIIDKKYSDTFARVDLINRTMAESLAALRKEFRAFAEEQCKSELQSLKDEIAALRDHTGREFQRLWEAIASLRKDQPPEKEEKLEPEEVRVSDDEVQSKDSHTGKGPKKLRSPKGRARSKSRSSRERRKRRPSYGSDDDRSSSSSDESEADMSEPERDDIRVSDKGCRRILSVDRYRLLDREPEKDLRLRTAKVLAHLKHLYEGDKFDGSDPITVLHFLEELKVAFDDAGLCEGDAKHMVRYFLDGEAARLFKGLTSQEKKTYPRIVKWLLRTYVRESMLLDAREKFLTRSQKPTETELDYSKALSDLSMRCAGLISERDLINRFVRGLSPAIRTHVQDRVKRNTSWAIAVALATDHGSAHREAQKEGKPQRELNFEPYSRKRYAPGKGKVFAMQPHVEGDTSSSEDWWARDQEPTVFPESARGTVGAIHYGSAPPQRNESFASLATSATSSEDRFYTPRSTFVGSADGRTVRPDAGQKVMLPPGVPFPQRRAPQGSAITATLPCLGCGRLGHWLTDCPKVNPKLKELALESLRMRKQARKLSFTDSRSHSPAREPAMVVASKEDPPSAPVVTEQREEEVATAHAS